MNYLKLFGFFFSLFRPCATVSYCWCPPKRDAVSSVTRDLFLSFFFGTFLLLLLKFWWTLCVLRPFFEGVGTEQTWRVGHGSRASSSLIYVGKKKNKQTKEQNNNQRNVAKNAGEADQKRKKKRKSETETSEPRHAKKKKKTKQKKTNKKSGPFFGWIRSVRLAQQHPPHPMRRHQVPSDFENIAFYFFQTREQPGNPRRSSSRIKNLETQATTTTTNNNNNSNNNNISVKRANPRTRRN